MSKKQSISFWRSFYLNIFSIILTLTLGTFSSLAEREYSLPEEEETIQNLSLTTEYLVNPQQNDSSETEQEPLDFSDTGRSGQQTAGETRSDQCADVSFPLTALVPSSNSGKTIATHPQLWFYVPYASKDIDRIEFVIQDADRQDIFRQTWQPQNIPGYLSASLPETEPALEANNFYRWYFKVYCHQEGNSAPLFVQGWIEKIVVSKDAPCPVELGQSHHMIYARKNLWYDAVNSLLDYYLITPNDLTMRTDWEKIIKAKGVDLKLPELEITNLIVRQN